MSPPAPARFVAALLAAVPACGPGVGRSEAVIHLTDDTALLQLGPGANWPGCPRVAAARWSFEGGPVGEVDEGGRAPAGGPACSLPSARVALPSPGGDGSGVFTVERSGGDAAVGGPAVRAGAVHVVGPDTVGRGGVWVGAVDGGEVLGVSAWWDGDGGGAPPEDVALDAVPAPTRAGDWTLWLDLSVALPAATCEGVRGCAIVWSGLVEQPVRVR